jgi:quercetin dioxygenase-like cupin family protein
MGAGACSGTSAGLKVAIESATAKELSQTLASLGPEQKAKLAAALAAEDVPPPPPPPGKTKFCAAFGGGAGPGANVDCCTMNPDNYKVVAELEECGSRLIEMTLPAGQGDKPHDHPIHYLYVGSGGKLKLSPPPGQTEGAAEVDMPDGAAMVIPAGPHQVTNVGDKDVKILFAEPTKTPKGGVVEGEFVSPLDVCPECYKKVAEDEEWFVGEMTMEPGMEDPPHCHHAHLVYVLEGDGITIWPGKEKGDAKMEVPIKPGMALPVPAGFHIVKNTGTVKCKLIFFELKK